MNSQKDIDKIDNLTEVSKLSGIGQQTLSRVKSIEQTGSLEIKEMLYNQKISVNQAYQEVRKEDKKAL